MLIASCVQEASGSGYSPTTIIVMVSLPLIYFIGSLIHAVITEQ